MSGNQHTSVFGGTIPEVYDQYLVPLIFESYAEDLARRAVSQSHEESLEVAAGTGVVTRALSAKLAPGNRLVATDLSQEMVDRAATIGTANPVTWRQADVMSLPFLDDTFDLVVCQFAVMFFASKADAFKEIRRVLRPGGRFIFSSWGRIEDNEFAHVVTQTLAQVFPEPPPDFLARIPHSYWNTDTMRADVQAGGFSSCEISMEERRSCCDTPEIPAIAYCQGTPLRNEIEACGSIGLVETTQLVTEALSRRFGSTKLDSKILGYVVTAS